MTLYSSREPFNVWVSEVTGQRYASPPKYGLGLERFDPRPEYDRPQNNPTNPILVQLRGNVALKADVEDTLNDLLAWVPSASVDHTTHTRKVLTRLAALKEEA